ncbi:MAG TPA: endonuclease III [Ignavibacteria bacterium]|nr:endonuclease III [Ignavibacteria bacterium]
MKKSEKVLYIIKTISKIYKSRNNKEGKQNLLDYLIATKLSQNTTDKSSFKAFTNLKLKFPDYNEIIEAETSELKNAISVCGLANSKATEIKNLLSGIKNKFGTLDFNFFYDFSNKKIFEELLIYKGFGVKTISCMIAFGMKRPEFPVDTHIHRILNRLGLVKTNTAEKTYIEAKKIIPEKYQANFHSDLIKFGRNICKAVNPLCGVCKLYDICKFTEKKFYKNKSLKSEITENNFIILENI